MIFAKWRVQILIVLTMIVLSTLPGALLAQDYAPPDPDAAAEQPLPDYDPDARLRGKTAIEHAEDLASSAMMRRLMALQALLDMGTDALAARDIVRFVIKQDETSLFPDAQMDEFKLGALSVLYAMQAPETLDLLRSKIIDPEFVTRDRSYTGLLDAAVQVGIEHETLYAI